MAFKMNKPLIKGSMAHKKMKESIVADTRTQADPNLVQAGAALGESYIPGSIDYNIDRGLKNIDFDKPEKQPRPGSKITPPDIELSDTEYEAMFEPETDDEDIKVKKEKKTKKKYIPEPEDEDEPIEIEDLPDEPKKKRGYKQDPLEIASKEQMERARQHAEENLKRRKREAEDRRVENIKPIERKKIEELPVDIEESMPKPVEAPKTKKKVMAEDNPKYQIADPKYDIEGNVISLGGTPPRQRGYAYHHEADQWTYNDIPITEAEVPGEAVEWIMKDAIKDQEIKKEFISKDIKKETKPVTIDKDSKIVKPREHQYRWGTSMNPGAWKKDGKKRYETDLKRWEQQKQDSAMQKRDDRIFRNARKGGSVQRNMIKNGYKIQ